jgi:DNA-binding response OmpR family regulator
MQQMFSGSSVDGRRSEIALKRIEGLYTVTLDDDPTVALIVEQSLGIANMSFTDSASLLRCVRQIQPVGVFIDVHLAESDCGLDVIPQVRTLWPQSAIIVITGDSSDDLVGQALTLGADDFIRKPLNPKELTARLKARIDDLIAKVGATTLSFGNLSVDTLHKSIATPTGSRELSGREVELLAELIRARGVIVSKGDLKRKLWGNMAISDNALDRKIFEVRKVLRDIGANVLIKAKYGEGLVLHTRSHAEDQLQLKDAETIIHKIVQRQSL